MKENHSITDASEALFQKIEFFALFPNKIIKLINWLDAMQ